MHWEKRERIIQIRNRMREAIQDILDEAEEEIESLEAYNYVQLCEV